MSSTIESDAPPQARVRLERDSAVVEVSGKWSLRGSKRPALAAVEHELEQVPQNGSVDMVATSLVAWDSSLLLFIGELEDWCKAHQLKLELKEMPEGVTSLIRLAHAVPERHTGRGGAPHPSVFEELGLAAIAAVRMFSAAMTFCGEYILSCGRILTGKGKVDWRLFWLTLQECSAQALPIVGLISFLTGLILAFVGAIQLRQFGAGIYVANLVAVAMAREMAAIMTGVIMAGRTGAAFAAQIGSMKVSEEIDALSTLAISPMDFLVTPRVCALFLMMPLLCLYSILLGIAGGAVVGVGLLSLTLVQYWNQTLGSMGLTDILTGVFKGSIFGVIIALTGCQRGMRCGNDAAGVGNAATSAVVLAITGIVTSDAIIDVLLEVLNI
jgi:phospholipid/cholesterol/gamma-HCH transport system permease protein